MKIYFFDKLRVHTLVHISQEYISPITPGTLFMSYVLVLVSLCFFAFGAVVHSPSTSIESWRGREAFLSPTSFFMSHMSKSGTGSQLCHSSSDGRCLGSRTVSVLPIALSRASSVLSSSIRHRRTFPHDHLSALIGLYVDELSSTSGAIQCFVPQSSSTSTCIAMSKSIIFKQKSSGSTRRLSGLMSLCATRSP